MAGEAAVKFDYSTLKDRPGPLGQETEAKIRDDAMREMAEEEAEAARIAAGESPNEGEKDKKTEAEKPALETEKAKTPDEKAAEDKAAQDKKAAEDLEAKRIEDEKASQAAADQAKADAAILAKKEEDLSEPEKTRKSEILKSENDELSKRVKLYADAEKISEEDAKKVIASEKSIAEKYGLDYKTPAGEKAARTIRSAQQMVSEKDTVIKGLSEQIEFAKIQDKIIINNKAMTFEEARPAMVEYYREVHPEMAEKTDEEVFTAAKTEYQDALKKRIDTKNQELATEAKSKRAKLILDLPDSAKPYQADIEKIVNSTHDSHIMNPAYNISDVILWSKGKNFDDAVKKARDEGFKAGQENRKILGAKSAESPESKTSASKDAANTAKGSAKRPLNEKEKQEALRKYDGVNIADDRKFELWAEILWEEEQEALKSKTKK